MRLIDADELYEDLANNLSSIMGDGSDGEAIDTYVNIGDIIQDTFNAEPTAYDQDKIVEQLENERKFWENAYNRNLGKEKARSYEHAIEIVKGGGVE